jgi:polysaccharide biosynthesis/export protein
MSFNDIKQFHALQLFVLSFSCYLLFSIGLPSNTGAQDYVIGVSDVIELSIYAGGEKQHGVNLEVSEKGTISVPFLGVIKAEGLTVEQLEIRIKEPLAKDYYVDPRVVIQIKEYHSKEFKIFGAVRSPGIFTVDSDISLLDLIAKAGGLSSDNVEFAYVISGSKNLTIEDMDELAQTGSSDPIKIDLTHFLESGSLENNIALNSGDYVYIPVTKNARSASGKIFIEGEVKNPGAIDFKPGLTALNACIIAGGFSKFAAPNRTRIIRQTGAEIAIIKIKLKNVKNGKIPDVELQPGDRIHVPQSWF